VVAAAPAVTYGQQAAETAINYQYFTCSLAASCHTIITEIGRPTLVSGAGEEVGKESGTTSCICTIQHFSYMKFIGVLDRSHKANICTRTTSVYRRLTKAEANYYEFMRPRLKPQNYIVFEMRSGRCLKQVSPTLCIWQK